MCSILEGQHFGAIEGLYASPDLEVFSSVKSLPARHHRTSRAIGIDPNSTESRPSFVKVRKHRHGRAATPVDVRCSHIEDSSSKRKGFVKHKEEDEASRRKAEGVQKKLIIFYLLCFEYSFKYSL